jgi:XRE family transcriptional regulator, master regulator for biofilm formation
MIIFVSDTERKGMLTLKSLGERFRELRKERKLSQDEVAERLEASKSFISYVENGQRDPSNEFLSKAASLFGVDIAEFYEHKIKSPDDLSKDGLKWIIFGEEMKKQGVSIDQVKEWVKTIKAFENK